MATKFDPAQHRPKSGIDSLPKCKPCRISRQVCNYPLGESICTRCQSSSKLKCEIDEQGRRTHMKRKENREPVVAVESDENETVDQVGDIDDEEAVESDENKTVDQVGDFDDEDTEGDEEEMVAYHSVQFAGLSNSFLNRDNDRDLFKLAKIVLNPVPDKSFAADSEFTNYPLQPILCCGASYAHIQPSEKENSEDYKELHEKMYYIFSHVGPENAFIGTPAGMVPWAKYQCFLGTLAEDNEGACTFRLFGLLDEDDLTSTEPDFDEIFLDRGECPDIVAGLHRGSEAVLVKGAEVEYRCLKHKAFAKFKVAVLRYSPAVAGSSIIDV